MSVETGAKLDDLLVKLDHAVAEMSAAEESSKPTKSLPVFDISRRVLLQEGGCGAIESRAAALEEAGIFAGSDWSSPEILVPSLTPHSLKSAVPETVVLEAISELRLLAIAKGNFVHPTVSTEQAHHYLTQVLAINLASLFGVPSETDRERQGRLALLAQAVLRHLADRIGYEHIIDQLVDEIWHLLKQRPIQTEAVKQMITQIAVTRSNPDIDLGTSGQGADRLVSSVFGPTQACREDPGVEAYQERIDTMDSYSLQSEATGFARAMHDTGLVSPYHAILLRHLLDHGPHLVSEGLGLSSTGRDCLLCYRQLVRSLIRESVYPQTAQAIYGLALTLERGILYQPPVAPALWRQMGLPVSPAAQERLTVVFGPEPSPQARLLEGVLCMLGQPLGVGQGNNPTCQSARALSMWAYNDPDYLLQIVAWAARDDEVIFHFEGQPISSRESTSGVAREFSAMELDPVSLVVAPHLDRIYAEMGRRCVGREGDPHRWVNPEFHGWWCGRGFRINVDVATGNLVDLDDFLRHFYASFHPFYNGNQPVIHPQPIGIAVTDSAARFIGWHAITILRVTLDPQGDMRVYFFNPNNDSAQDWGNGVEVSVTGNDERNGESSLPFEQFASRLYIFHFDPLEHGEVADVADEELARVIELVHGSWGKTRTLS